GSGPLPAADEAFLLEGAQRLAQRHTAHSQRVGQLRLRRELRAGRIAIAIEEELDLCAHADEEGRLAPRLHSVTSRSPRCSPGWARRRRTPPDLVPADLPGFWPR